MPPQEGEQPARRDPPPAANEPEGLIIEDDVPDFDELFASLDDDAQWFVHELNATCAKAVDGLNVPRENAIQAINIYREEIEQQTAPVAGPTPATLQRYLATRNLAEYTPGARTVIGLIDDLVQDALRCREIDQQTLRTAFLEYAVTLDYVTSR